MTVFDLKGCFWYFLLTWILVSNSLIFCLWLPLSNVKRSVWKNNIEQLEYYCISTQHRVLDPIIQKNKSLSSFWITFPQTYTQNHLTSEVGPHSILLCHVSLQTQDSKCFIIFILSDRSANVSNTWSVKKVSLAGGAWAFRQCCLVQY